MFKGKALKVSFWLALLIFIFLIPLWVKDPYILHTLIGIGIFSIVALGVRLIMLSGQWSFGQAGFLLVGAYSSALLVTRLGLSFWAAIILAGLITAVFAIAIGYITMRVKAVYFAIITLAIGEAISLSIRAMSGITGGSYGLYNLPAPNPIHLPGLLVEFTSKTPYYYLMLILVIVSALAMYRVERIRGGNLFDAILQKDILAESLGINTLKYRVLAFSVACGFTGMAGAFAAHYYLMTRPDFYGLLHSIYAVTYVIIGGVGSIFGPIIGVILLLSAVEFLRAAAMYQAVAYAVVFLVVILIFPGGLVSLGQQLWARATALLRRATVKRYPEIRSRE